MSGASGLTLECWIKPGDVSAIHPLLEFNNGATYGTLLWIYGNPQSIYANFVDTGGTSHTLSAPSYLITTNDFQHVAATYDHAGGNAVLYYNGAPVLTTNLGSFIPQTGYDLYLGRRPGTSYYYNGLLDEVGVYNRALSATEIAGIYNESASGFGFAPTNWLVLDFGSSYSTNPNSAANVDTNSDGLLNWQKYFYGDNPAGTNPFSIWVGQPAITSGVP